MIEQRKSLRIKLKEQHIKMNSISNSSTKCKQDLQGKDVSRNIPEIGKLCK